MSVTADIEEARKNIEANYERVEKTGFGRYLISLKPSSSTETKEEAVPFPQLIEKRTPVGVVSMQLARFPDGPTIPDVGFRVHAQHQGKGYATEAASELMRYYEEKRGFKGFAAMCAVENEASKNVMKRLGFENRGERDVLGVLGEGVVLRSLVWTKGVGEGDLAQWGF